MILDKSIFKSWLPLVIASTIIMLTFYVITQQEIRLGANVQVLQMAEDGAATLSAGTEPEQVVPNAHVEMTKSLANFVIVYDDSGKVLASSGYLNNQVPVLPPGVFEYARTNPDDRITWQPASTTRLATVIKHFDGKNPGFIVAGHNLREAEDRIRQIGLIAFMAWIGLVVLTFVATIYAGLTKKSEILRDSLL